MPQTADPLAATSVPSAPGVTRNWPRWFRLLLALFAAGLLLVILAYAFRAPLFTGFANLWIVDDPPAKADAVVVLGGGLEYRPAAAAKLYREGYAPKILITDRS